MKKYRIIGPPGTGKTEYCINLIKDLIEKGQYRLEDFAVFSFTKTAEINFRKRALSILKVKEDQLDCFRTIHSYAMEKTNIKHDMIIHSPYTDFIKKYSDPNNQWTKEQIFHGDESTGENLYLNFIDKANLKYGNSLEDVLRLYDESSLFADKIKRNILTDIFKKFSDYKKAPGSTCYTFSDVIYEFLKTNISFDNIKVLLMDEAQDADPLNWKFFDKIEEQAELSYIIGDPNQAIYQFKGAVPEEFLKREVTEEIEMPQSYRLPRVIHEFSNKFIHFEKLKRVSFKEKPGAEGYLKEIGSNKEAFELINKLSTLNESTFIISRVKSENKKFELHLFNNNIPWLRVSSHRKADGSYWEPIISDKIQSLIKDLDTLLMGDVLTGKELIRLIKAMPAKKTGIFDNSRALCKSRLKGEESPINPDHIYSLEYLEQEFKMKIKDKHWTEILEIEAPKSLRCTNLQYYRFIDSLKEKGILYEKPKFTVATIHAVKGMESENVLLNTVLTSCGCSCM